MWRKNQTVLFHIVWNALLVAVYMNRKRRTRKVQKVAAAKWHFNALKVHLLRCSSTISSNVVKESERDVDRINQTPRFNSTLLPHLLRPIHKVLKYLFRVSGQITIVVFFIPQSPKDLGNGIQMTRPTHALDRKQENVNDKHHPLHPFLKKILSFSYFFIAEFILN